MEKIKLRPFMEDFFTDNFGDQYKVRCDHNGKLIFYKRGSKKINPTTWIATEKKIFPETWMLEKYEAAPEEV